MTLLSYIVGVQPNALLVVFLILRRHPNSFVCFHIVTAVNRGSRKPCEIITPPRYGYIYHLPNKIDAPIVSGSSCSPSPVRGPTFNVPSSGFWAEMNLAVNMEIVTKKIDRAVDLFAETILKDARGCQGSNRLLLRSLEIAYPFG